MVCERCIHTYRIFAASHCSVKVSLVSQAFWASELSHSSMQIYRPPLSGLHQISLAFHPWSPQTSYRCQLLSPGWGFYSCLSSVAVLVLPVICMRWRSELTCPSPSYSELGPVSDNWVKRRPVFDQIWPAPLSRGFFLASSSATVLWIFGWLQ